MNAAFRSNANDPFQYLQLADDAFLARTENGANSRDYALDVETGVGGTLADHVWVDATFHIKNNLHFYLRHRLHPVDKGQ